VISLTKIRLAFVVEDVDRHGNVRRYFRRKGQPKIRLRGLPGSTEFMNAYQVALSGEGRTKKPANARNNRVLGRLIGYAKHTLLVPSSSGWTRAQSASDVIFWIIFVGNTVKSRSG